MPATPTYRAAIIGCGDIGGLYDETRKEPGVFSHAGAYKQVERIDLVAAADIDRRRLQEFARFWEVEKVYEDYRDLLQEENLHLVSVCTPDETHYQVLMDILDLNAPRLIFAEKPLTTSSKTEMEVLRRAEEKGTRIVVDYQRRWEPEHQAVAMEIREGAIGQIQAVSAYYVKGLRHVGCTTVDTLRFLISQIASVVALPPYRVGTFPDKDPSMDAVLFFRREGKAIIQSCDKHGYTYSLFEIDILGSEGRIRILENGDRVIRYRTAPYAHYPGFRELERYDEVATRMPLALTDGVQAIVEILDRDLADYTNHGLESYKDSLVLDAISLSQKRGGVPIEVTG